MPGAQKTNKEDGLSGLSFRSALADESYCTVSILVKLSAVIRLEEPVSNDIALKLISCSLFLSVLISSSLGLSEPHFGRVEHGSKSPA